MKKRTLLLVVVLTLCACGDRSDGVKPAEEEKPAWQVFAAATVDEYYRRNPERAVYVGLHEYDGRMSDFSLAAAEGYADWIDRTVAAADAYEELTRMEAFERDYLVNALRGDRFWIRESGFLRTNPVNYAFMLDFDVYIDRPYAPIEQRMVAYTKYASQLSSALKIMRENLEPPLPLPYVETAKGIFAGLADYMETTVPGLFSAVDDEQLQRQFAAVNTVAANAARETATWLEAQKKTAAGSTSSRCVCVAKEILLADLFSRDSQSAECEEREQGRGPGIGNCRRRYCRGLESGVGV